MINHEPANAEGFIQAHAAIEINSVVSDGRYLISEVIEKSRKAGIKIVVLSDNFLARWE